MHRTTSVRIAADVADRVRNWARSQGMQLSRAIERACLDWLDNRPVFNQAHLRSDGHDLIVELAETSDGPYFEIIRSRGDGEDLIVSHGANIPSALRRKGRMVG